MMRTSNRQKIIVACASGGTGGGDGDDPSSSSSEPDDFLRIGGTPMYTGSVTSSMIALGVVLVGIGCAMMKQMYQRRQQDLGPTSFSAAAAQCHCPGWLIAGPHSVIASMLLTDGLLLAITTSSSSNMGYRVYGGVAVVVGVVPVIVAAYALSCGFQATWVIHHLPRRQQQPLQEDKHSSSSFANLVDVSRWTFHTFFQYFAWSQGSWRRSSSSSSSPHDASRLFLLQYEPLFGGCRLGARGYFLIETGFGFVTSAIVVTAVSTSGDNSNTFACTIALPLLCAIQIAAALAALGLQPCAVRYEQWLMVGIAIVGAVSAILDAIGGEDDVVDALGTLQLVVGGVLALVGIYVTVEKRQRGWTAGTSRDLLNNHGVVDSTTKRFNRRSYRRNVGQEGTSVDRHATLPHATRRGQMAPNTKHTIALAKLVELICRSTRAIERHERNI